MPPDAGALHLLLSGPDQAATALVTVALLAAAALVGVALRRKSPGGMGLGLLVLAGGADISLFIMRAATLPLDWMAPLCVAFTLLMTLVLRRWVLAQSEAAAPSATRTEVALAIALLAAFWVVRILQVDPSSGLSSQLGWTPLYVKASVEAGHFLLPQEFRFGVGPADSLFYSVDMLGLVALAGALGIKALYPVYLATSIAGTGLALAITLAALRGRVSAQLGFAVLLAILAVADGQFQAAVLRHWGDTILILGGSLIMVALARADRDMTAALRDAAAASVLLVLGRHYGAFFSAALMAGGGLILLRSDPRAIFRLWPAMVALGALLAGLAAREVNYILHPALYYPGSKLLSLTGSGVLYHVHGALHDWGFMTDGCWTPIGPRTLWLAALAVLLWWGRRHKGAALPLIAPMAVMLLPALLHAVTGYRSSGQSNKPYLLATFFMAWYPAFIACRLLPHGRLERSARRLALAAVLAVVPLALAGSLTAWGPGALIQWGSQIYRARIVDLNVAQAAAQAGIAPDILARRPIMYFYCEPGMAIRLYLGGDIIQDYDFWGAAVQDRLAGGQSFEQILDALGRPNLYLSSKADYGAFVATDHWRGVLDLLRSSENLPWMQQVIQAGDARLIITRER